MMVMEKHEKASLHLARPARMEGSKISLLPTLAEFQKEKAEHPISTVALAAKKDPMKEELTVKKVGPLRAKEFWELIQRYGEKPL